MRKFALIALLTIAGCAHSLRPDPVKSAIESNYPTAEFSACGKDWHGLGMCSLIIGEDYSGINLKVEVYYNGTLTVESKDCQISTKVNYQGSQTIDVFIPGKAEKNCIFAFTVTPEYPKEESQTLKVYSFRGHLGIQVRDIGVEWTGFTAKLTNNFNHTLKFWIGPVDTAIMEVSGCGHREPIQRQVKLENGFINTDLSKLLPDKMNPKDCIIEGWIANEEFEDLLFAGTVSKYDSRFTPLAVPVLEMKDGELWVKGDEAVSFVGLDSEYKITNEYAFEFDENQKHTLRLLTIGGRSVIGYWNPESKKWNWKN